MGILFSDEISCNCPLSLDQSVRNHIHKIAVEKIQQMTNQELKYYVDEEKIMAQLADISLDNIIRSIVNQSMDVVEELIRQRLGSTDVFNVARRDARIKTLEEQVSKLLNE